MNSGLGNMILGAVGMLLIGAFLVGLAISIGSVPFGIIVAAVLIMALFEYYQDGVQPFLRSRGGDRSETGR